MRTAYRREPKLRAGRRLSAAAGAMCLALYLWLGAALASTPPGSLDASAAALVGRGAGLALLLTDSYSLQVLGLVGLALALVAWRAPAWRSRVLFSILLTLCAWRLSDLGKAFFQRARPEHWVLQRETSFSYASGHAMYAVIVSWLWAVFVWNSELPRTVRAIVTPLLIAWGAGAIWSRLALGAHYPSDLLGGLLFGAGLLTLGAALWPAPLFERPDESPTGARGGLENQRKEGFGLKQFRQ